MLSIYHENQGHALFLACDFRYVYQALAELRPRRMVAARITGAPDSVAQQPYL